GRGVGEPLGHQLLDERDHERDVRRGARLVRGRKAAETPHVVVEGGDLARGQLGDGEPFLRGAADHLVVDVGAVAVEGDAEPARVVGSPAVCLPAAMSRGSRRMIFPLRVLGSASVKRMSSGRAKAPISLATCSRSTRLSSSLGVRLDSSVTKAAIAWPFSSSGRPTTAASATAGWLTSALSTSIVPRRWPATFTTSS